MPVDPEIDDAGPTREHKGTGAFSHIVSNEPKPMMSDGMPSSATVNKWIAVAGGHKRLSSPDGWSPQRRWDGGGEKCRDLRFPRQQRGSSAPQQSCFTQIIPGCERRRSDGPCCQGKRGGSVSVFAMNRSRGLKRVDYFSAA
jgi:hypothetical protein